MTEDIYLETSGAIKFDDIVHIHKDDLSFLLVLFLT